MPRPRNFDPKVPDSHDPEVNRGISEKKGRGDAEWDGRFVRVKVFPDAAHPTAGWLTFTCGVKPPVSLIPGDREWVVPIEIFNVIQDCTVQVIDHRIRIGRPTEVTEKTVVRYPYQYLGEATREDYDAQLKEHAKRPLATVEP